MRKLDIRTFAHHTHISLLQMATLSLPAGQFVASLSLSSRTQKVHSSNLLFQQLKPSQSQLYGVKLSTPASSSTWVLSTHASTSKRMNVIVAGKVTKGTVPPSFTLKDQDGKTVSLSKFKGKPVVLYFYPADESPGCTKQACAFRDSYEKFKKAGAEVVGISGDDVASHKAFAKKYRLPYTLLADEGNKVRQDWGVPGDLFGALPGRQTYVLDKQGVVQLIYNNQFQPEKHIDETLKLLQTL